MFSKLPSFKNKERLQYQKYYVSYKYFGGIAFKSNKAVGIIWIRLFCFNYPLSNGGEAGGFECSDPKCESNNDVFERDSAVENEIFTVLGLIFLLIVCYGLFK